MRFTVFGGLCQNIDRISDTCTDVLFKTRVNMAPRVDAGHPEGGIALKKGTCRSPQF
jgi:hypothetical protein